MVPAKLKFTDKQVLAMIRMSNALLSYMENFYETADCVTCEDLSIFKATTGDEEEIIHKLSVESAMLIFGAMLKFFNLPQGLEDLYCNLSASIEEEYAISTLSRMSLAKRRVAAAYLNLFMELDVNPSEIKLEFWKKLCLNANLPEISTKESLEIMEKLAN